MGKSSPDTRSVSVSEANQLLEDTRNEFRVRFYEWAQKDARREFEEGFPFVKCIKNVNTLRFMSFIERLQEGERAVFRSALLKRAHRSAAEIRGDTTTADEGAFLDLYSRWQDTRLQMVAPRQGQVRVAKCRKLLPAKLSPIVGPAVGTEQTAGALVFETNLHSWKVQTWITVGRKGSLSYSHVILAQDLVYLHDNISVLSWLGIAQTDWAYAQEGQEEVVVDCLARACAHFFASVGELLDGLSHDLPKPRVHEWRQLVTVRGYRERGMTIVALDDSELRKIFGSNATWDIPTSIIPHELRTVGSHFVIIQDPAFSRESDDPAAVSPTYRHVRVERSDD